MAATPPSLDQRLVRRDPMRVALALLAALAWLLTMQPLGAAAGAMGSPPDRDCGIETPAGSAAAAADRPGHGCAPAGACGACPSFCCAAALPVLSSPGARQEATIATPPSTSASLLAGRSPTPDPPPPRQA